MAGRYEISGTNEEGDYTYVWVEDELSDPVPTIGTGNEQDVMGDPYAYYDTKTGEFAYSAPDGTTPDWLKYLNAGGDAAKKVLSGNYGMPAQLASYAALGAAAKKLGLVNDGQQGIYKGYEGGIPNLVAARQQVPLGDTTNYRPGQGGRTYFTPTRYMAPADAVGVQAAQTQEAKNIAAQQVPVAKAAGGGISALGGYSDGGRMLRGPGDGVSDSIPATIGGKQPARLADGEFVIPARIVSEIGNGSSEAGARKLYAMMDRIQKARKKSIKNVAANTKADKYLPR
jgi:hypothetical protein